MTMRKILIMVEGQTEETFVREVLEPHFLTLNISIVPTLAKTKIVKIGVQFKGGIVSYGQVTRDLRKLLTDSSASVVTTMIDFYGLPGDFPGQASKPLAGTCYQRVRHLELEFQRDINHPRFVPHLMLHEFETLVFTDPSKCSYIFKPEISGELARIRSGYSSPEEINEGLTTAPSKRLQTAFPKYQKTVHGPLAVLEIGLPAIRDACPHFHEWLHRLERI